MDEGRFSILPDALYHHLGSAAVGARGVNGRHGRDLPLQDRDTPDLVGMFGGWALRSLCRSGRMTPSRALAAAIALSLIILPSALEAQMLDTLRVDLSRVEPGQEPEGFVAWRTGEGGAARWVVVEDATASQGRAIAQMSNERTDYRFPLAVYKPFSGKNLEVRLRFKAVAGSVDAAGGIALRLNTPDDYYVVRANALEDNVRFYRVAKGRRTQIAGADTKVSAKEWHALALRAEGERFTISFDGKVLFTAADKTLAEPGKVALWTKADSITHFDAIEITPLP
jgi:hypothetical protein